MIRPALPAVRARGRMSSDVVNAAVSFLFLSIGVGFEISIGANGIG
jgi:hypothetical protein